MAGPHENMEHAEHAEHASHGGNKKIALLISVLALFLAFSETLGKSAQTNAITLNVASNDLWAFFQAKTIRITVLKTAAEQMQIEADRATDPALKARLTKTIDSWKRQRHALRRRRQIKRRPQATRRTRQTGGRKARIGDDALSPLRTGLGRIADRHRAGVG